VNEVQARTGQGEKALQQAAVIGIGHRLEAVVVVGSRIDHAQAVHEDDGNVGAGAIEVRDRVRDAAGLDRDLVVERGNLSSSLDAASPDRDALYARIRDAAVIRRRHPDRAVESRGVEEDLLVLEDARIHDQVQLGVERERQHRANDRFR